MASLKESDPRLYEGLVRAEAEDQQRQAHMEHLQQLFEQDPNAGDHEWIVRATLGVPEDEG